MLGGGWAARGAFISCAHGTFTRVEDADSGYWTAGVLECPGSNVEGASPDEAIADARRGLVDFIDIYLEQGRAVPDPFETRAPAPGGPSCG